VVEANPFSFPIVRVAIAKRDEPSYGMTFIGPENNGPRTGVFITRVKPDLPASREVDDEGKCVIKPGMRILGMNGKSVQEKSKTEAVEILQGGTLTCVMTLQLDPEGFAFYDNGALKAQLLAETEAIDEAAE